MATTLRAVAQNNSTTGTAISVGAPTGTTTGDVVIITIHANGNTTIVDNNGSTPFTEDLNDYQPNAGSGHTVSIFSRRIQASDPTTFNFTSGASGRWSISASTWQNPHATDIYDVAPNTSNAAAASDAVSEISAPSINTNTNNAIHVVLAGWDTGNLGSITEPSGYTNINEIISQPQGSSYKVIATAGATGAQQYESTEDNPRFALSFAIKDVGTGGGDQTISVSENITITEAIDIFLGTRNISVSDSITLTESKTVQYPKPLSPVLDSGHSLATGILLAWAFSEGTGDDITDFSGNGHHGEMLDFADPNAAWVDGAYGKMVRLDGTNDRVRNVSNTLSALGTAARTVLFLINNRTTSGVNVFGTLGNGIVKDGFYANGTQLNFWNGGSGDTEISASGWTTGYHTLIAQKPSTASGGTAYVDNNTPLSLNDFSGSSPSGFLVGLADIDTGNDWHPEIDIVAAYVWDRELTSDERVALLADPFIFLRGTAIADLSVNVSDSVTITEGIGRLLESNRAVSDSITTTESVGLFRTPLYLSVSDSITTTESVKAELNSLITVSDSITITESIKTDTNLQIAKGDLTFLQAAADTTDVSTYTFAGQNLGTAAANRYIIVSILSRKAGAATTLTGVTIGGVAATIVRQQAFTDTNTNVAAIVVANVPTGATGDIVVTFADAMVRCMIGVYRATGINPTATFSDYSITTPLQTSMVIPGNGFGIAAGMSTSNSSATWAGLTEDFDAVAEAIVTYTGAHKEYSTGQTVVTTITFGATSSPIGIFAAWKFNGASDTIAVSESTTVAIASVSDLSISVSDSITITESVGRMLESYINTSESITVTESVGRMLESRFAVSESITVADTPGIIIPELYLSASDSITVTEAVAPELISNITVSDSITITENIGGMCDSSIAVSDSITISESFDPEQVSHINVSDEITISEATLINFEEGSVGEMESVSVSESVAVVLSDPQIIIKDTITVTENSNVDYVYLVGVSEEITLSENNVGVLTSNIQVLEDITLTESTIITVSDPQISVSDSIAINENRTILIPTLDLEVSETITITEANTTLIPVLFASVSDSITATDTPAILGPDMDINKSELITVSESTGMFTDILYLSVSDAVTVTEQVLFQPEYWKNQPFYLDIGDGLSIMLGAPRMAIWGTNGRPQIPRTGEYGINDELGQLEVWDGSQWLYFAPDAASATTITSSTALTYTQSLVFVDATLGSVTLTIPSASGNSGKQFNIKKIDASINTIILDPIGSETIDGDTTLTVLNQYDSVTIASNGSNWFII